VLAAPPVPLQSPRDHTEAMLQRLSVAHAAAQLFRADRVSDSGHGGAPEPVGGVASSAVAARCMLSLQRNGGSAPADPVAAAAAFGVDRHAATVPAEEKVRWTIEAVFPASRWHSHSNLSHPPSLCAPWLTRILVFFFPLTTSRQLQNLEFNTFRCDGSRMSWTFN
jgi:hypothetical protein